MFPYKVRKNGKSYFMILGCIELGLRARKVGIMVGSEKKRQETINLVYRITGGVWPIGLRVIVAGMDYALPDIQD